MDKNQLKIIVKIINEGKAGLASVEKGLDKIDKKAKSVGASTRGANAGTAGFVKTILGATTVIKGFDFAINLVEEGVKAFVEVSKNALNDVVQFEAAMIGLTSIAEKFGYGADEAKQAAISLSKDGLMSVTDASAGLKNLLATGFGMEESIKLMEGFKDSAAFNRQGQLELGQAIVGATQGIKNQNSVMVDNAGVTKNLSNILKEQGLSQQDLSNVTSDANVRQALYNGLLQETALFSGDAAKLSGIFGGQLSQLNTTTETLSTAFGFVLKPSVESIITPIVKLGREFTEFFAENQETLEMFGEDLSTIFSIATGNVQNSLDSITPENIIIAMGEIAKGIGVIISTARLLGGALQLAFDLSPLMLFVNGIKSVKLEIQRLVDLFYNIDLTNLEETQKRFTEINKQASQEQADLFENSYIKPLKNVNNSYRDLQKVLDFDVRKSFQEAAKNSKKSANVAGKSWKDNLTNIGNASANTLNKIAEESEKFIDRMVKSSKQFQERLDDLILSHREKTNNLKADLAKEKKELQNAINEQKNQANKEIAIIDDTAKAKIKILEEEIKREEAANLESEDANIASLEQQIRDIEKAKNEEINVVEKALNEEIVSIKEKRQERINEVQAGLNEELKLQNKFTDDFKRLKDAVAEDDITRLKRKFAEETKELELQHQKRLASLSAQGKSQGQAFSGGFSAGTLDVKTRINDVLAEFGRRFSDIFQNITTTFDLFKGHQGGAQSFSGGITRINEAGGEIVNLPNGSQIIPAQRTKEIINNNQSNTTSSINVSVNANRFMGSKTEARKMAMEVVEGIRSLSMNRGLSPTEFLNLG